MIKCYVLGEKPISLSTILDDLYTLMYIINDTVCTVIIIHPNHLMFYIT